MKRTNMKKLFTSLVALMVATMSFAQELVATLSHDDNITMFYGTFALRDALEAAVSGDVINLSGGSFQAEDIEKAVTLRGTGIDDVNPTFIINSFTIEVPTDDANRLSMEGIRCTGSISTYGEFNNAYFLKCQFDKIYIYSTCTCKNMTFANCKLTNTFLVYSDDSSVQFVNSYVGDFQSISAKGSSFSFYNCVIKRSVNIYYSHLYNCIIYGGSGSGVLGSSNSAYHCVSIGTGSVSDNHLKNEISTFEEMFKDFTGTYSDEQTFELTDAAKTKFLGNDGTEVGIYGGLMPYRSTPTYPLITKMNVAKKTTADGQLDVEIEVSTTE